MVFSSYPFLLIFLPLTLFGFVALRAAGLRRTSVTFLLIASFAFYGVWSVEHLKLLLFSIVVNYGCGRYASSDAPDNLRRLATAAGVLFNLGLIFWFKYLDFAGSNLAALIGAIQKPPFEKVGVFDVETFYPSKERLELAMAINNLLASPGFVVWLEGEPLDVQRLLFTPEGKPRISIVSIAHLTDAERMFVVTLVANELVAWMRQQPGTSALRALFYMDEIFGFFPPSARSISLISYFTTPPCTEI